jgi:hypothetical protein
VSQHTTNRAFDDLARALAEGSISRRRALKLFAGTAIAALIPSRALARQQKVIICHKPGTPDEETIEVSQSAVNRHLDHGDQPGRCGTTTTTTSTTSTSTSTSSTTSTSTSTSTTTPTTSTSTSTTTPTTSTSTSTTTPTTSTSTSTTSTTPMCRPNGFSPCDADSECCSSICDHGLVGGPFGRCATCRSQFAGCDADSECCSGICSLTSCLTCRDEGDFCNTTDDCCSSLTCQGGFCTLL